MNKRPLKQGQIRAENISPDRIALSANSFLIAAKRCSEERLNSDGTFEMVIMPAVSMGAFSMELFLKAILAKLKIKPGHIHNLVKLYALLPANTRLELWMASGFAQDEFEAYLENSADSFEEFRYFFEFDAAFGHPQFLIAAAQGAKAVFEKLG